MHGIFRRLFIDSDGSVLAEHGLLLVLIAIAAVAAITQFGLSLFGLYDGFPVELFN